MRKNILILVFSVVIFSLFNTTDTNFKLWDTPSVNTTHIHSPAVPISFNDDISVLGLVINFFTDIDLDYSESDDSHSVDLQLSVGLDNDHREIEEYTPSNTIQPSYEQEEFKEVVEVEAVEEIADVIEEASDIVNSIEDVSAVLEEQAVEEVVNSIAEVSAIVEEQAVEEVMNSIPEEVFAIVEEKAVEEQFFEEQVVEEQVVEEQVVESTPNQEVEEPLPDDKDIIRQHPNIKENAKKMILEALEEGDITMDDVFDLLNKYAGKDLNKKKVKQFIKNNRK